MMPSGCKTAAQKGLQSFGESCRVYHTRILHIVKNAVENV